MNNEYRYLVYAYTSSKRLASPCIKQKRHNAMLMAPQPQGLDWDYWAMQMLEHWRWRCRMRRMWQGITKVFVGGGGAWPPAGCNTHTCTQEPLEAQVVPREAWTLYWCWVMLTTSPAVQDCDKTIGRGCHKRSCIGCRPVTAVGNTSPSCLAIHPQNTSFFFFFLLLQGSVHMCVHIHGREGVKCVLSFSHFPD